MGHPLGDGADGYTGDTGDGQNPAWNNFLEVIPQELHDKVTPLLTEWDKGVQDKFTKVQQEYAPWKDVISAAGNPQEAAFALQLMRAVQEDPEMIYNSLKERYKFGETPPEVTAQGQGQGEPQTLDPAIAARIQQLEQGQQTVAQIIQAQHTAELEAREAQALDSELSNAKKQYGDFDERFVLALAANGVPVMDAAKQFADMKTAIAQQYSPKPLIMGAGGGMPSVNKFDVKKVSDGQLNDFVVQHLAAAKAQQQQ